MIKRTCIEDDCTEPAARRNGMCDAHYRRAVDARKPKCTVDDCQEPAHIRELCRLHYSRWHRLGTTELPVKAKRVRPKCSIDGCERDSNCRGWCELHYGRWRTHGDPEKVAVKRRAPRMDPAAIDVEGKVCSTCKRRLPLSGFYRRATTPDGLMYRCKDCCRDAFNKRYAEDEDFRKHRTELERDHHKNAYERRKEREHVRGIARYGITPEDFDALAKAQGGVCAICKRPPQGKTRLSVDHGHKSGLVRGLLCDPCNIAIGLLDDDIDRLRGAIRYLEAAGLFAA